MTSMRDKIAATAERHGKGWVACESLEERRWGPSSRRGIQAWFATLPGTEDASADPRADAERQLREAA